jgi:hypothetical protein
VPACNGEKKIMDRTPASASIFVQKGLTLETRNFAAAAHSRMAIHRTFILHLTNAESAHLPA